MKTPTLEDLREVAHLARLRMPDEELARLGGHVQEFLAYVSKIEECDVDGVEPMTGSVGLVNVFRADEPQPSLTQEQALANAPERQGGFFKLPY